MNGDQTFISWFHSCYSIIILMDNNNTKLINRPKAFDNVHVQFLSNA